jgi:indolepyruvate ferredoxin oxidoreductase
VGKALKEVTLADKYTQNSGTILISGSQALARLPMLQQQLDQQAGLNTGGFISGYRGSPIGGYDFALWQIKDLLASKNIVFQPGLNEDLAATAVAGSQQLNALPGATVDGVYAIWYGKGPGVDRSMDAMKHGNYAGTHPNGGVLFVYGDDHPGKSSTMAHQSEQALAAQLMPSLYPSGVDEFFEFGLLGWALSRYSGLWVGIKCVNETVEQTATCSVDLDNYKAVLPTPNQLPPEGISYRGGVIDRETDERIVHDFRLPLVHQFVRANAIDRSTLSCEQRKLGLISAGKSWRDTSRALELLGISESNAEQYGLSVYKVGCIWPLEPEGIKDFSKNQKELLVIEEKKTFLEEQIANILFNLDGRPKISGKETPDGSPLLSSIGQLKPLNIALAIASRLDALGLSDTRLEQHVAQCEQKLNLHTSTTNARSPFFCSGCPHNRSTKVPEGSHTMIGTGCHAIALFCRPDTISPMQMGGEGTNWIGLSPFTKTPHIFQNLGDGTYYHSGLMAIRASVAANTNITYKLLYNDAVAMTGGQPVDGPLSVAAITHQVLHEGVKRCVLLTDDLSKFTHNTDLAPGVDIFYRDELDRVQRELRETQGCTVLIYEQTCAAEKRRRRKRGTFPDPDKRLFINDAVCEGCGDCSTQSNCVSLQPLETEFGRKRKIDQSSCNKDYSCVDGFCPSFVTIYNAKPRKPSTINLGDSLCEKLPTPIPYALPSEGYNIMIAGVGGTGVITVGAILAMAANLEQKSSSVFDITGLSQKNGAVYSHLKMAQNASDITTQAIGIGEANVVLGFDMLAATSNESFHTLAGEKSHFVGNSTISPTAAFQFNPDETIESEQIVDRVKACVGDSNLHLVDATRLALALCGDSIAANLLLIGFAAQRGLLPVSLEAIEQAVKLNGIAVDFNLNALRLGRIAAHSPKSLEDLTKRTDSPVKTPQSYEELLSHRYAHLCEYQNQQYADKYRETVEKIAKAEQNIGLENRSLATAVAKYYAKLLAYKDEYEVARLYSNPHFLEKLQDQFEGKLRLAFNLAPPLISKRDSQTGQLQKSEYGAWILPAFKILSKFRFLRGTAFDIFGYTKERREERQLIEDYEELLTELAGNITKHNHSIALELAQLPESIRGFGHIKDENIINTKKRWQQLLQAFRGPAFVEVRSVD